MATPKGSAGGSAGAILGAIAGPLGEVVTAVQSLTASISLFVDAISPSTMREFQMVVRDVSATIGSAFVGAFNIISAFVREIGGVLLPVMQQLEPVMRTLAHVIGRDLLSAASLVAVGLELLAPLLQVVADYLNEFSKFTSDLITIVVALGRVLKDVLGAFFGGGDMKDVFKGFVDILRQAVKALVTFAATLAVFAGFRDTVKAFADSIAKEAKAKEDAAGGLKAAATNPTLTDVAAIARQYQLAAFTAAGAGAAKEKDDTAWLKEISASLKDTAATKKSFEEAVSDWWKKEVVGGGGLLGKVLSFFDVISERIKTFLGKFGA